MAKSWRTKPTWEKDSKTLIKTKVIRFCKNVYSDRKIIAQRFNEYPTTNPPYGHPGKHWMLTNYSKSSIHNKLPKCHKHLGRWGIWVFIVI